jgi:hypothetical protein
VKFSPEAKAEMQAAGLWRPEYEGNVKGALDTYRDVRDMRNERTAAGGEQNKWAARIGTGAGVVPTIAAGFGPQLGKLLPVAASRVAPTAGRFAQLLGKVGAGAETGAAYGTLYAMTNGRADLTRGEFSQAAQDIAGTEGWKNSIENYSKGNYGRSFLDMLGAGATGGALGGALAPALVEGVQKTPGLARAVERFARSRAVKATEPDLAHYRMLERQGRLDELGADLLENKIVTPFASTTNIADRAAAVAEDRGAKIGQFLDDVDSRSYVETKNYEVPVAQHGMVPRQTERIQPGDWRVADRKVPVETVEHGTWSIVDEPGMVPNPNRALDPHASEAVVPGVTQRLEIEQPKASRSSRNSR